jgi:hypothetical protein
MFKIIAKGDCGSRYETADSVLLLDIEDFAEEHPEMELELTIHDYFTRSWCSHSHDCCGCWRTTVSSVTIDPWNAVVHLRHTQNV